MSFLLNKLEELVSISIL